MKKIFCVLLFCSGMNAVAQISIFGDNLQSSNQQLIEEAVKDGIFVLRRCYQLKDVTTDPPRFYGYQSLNYHGETYSLGIKGKDGYYIDDKAVRPWIYDRKFDEYLNSEQFVPVVSASEYRMLDNTDYSALQYREEITKEISSHRLYLEQDTVLFQQKGFSVDGSDGLKKGWLVWVHSDRPIEDDNNQKLSFSIFRSELTFEAGKEIYEVRELQTDKHILGGFYILPVITEIGQITFHLSGVLHRENDKWQVVRMNTAGGERQQESRLTPIDTGQGSSGDSRRDNRRR